MKFGLKLWNSDSTSNASARLVLSVLALPLTGPEIDKYGVGIEIFISNKQSALRLLKYHITAPFQYLKKTHIHLCDA